MISVIGGKAVDTYFANTDELIQNRAADFKNRVRVNDEFYRVSVFLCPNHKAVVESCARVSPDKAREFRHGEPMPVRERIYHSLLLPQPTLGLQKVVIDNRGYDSVEGRSVLFNPFNRPRSDVLQYAEKYGLTERDPFVIERYLIDLPGGLPNEVDRVKIFCRVEVRFIPLQKQIKLNLYRSDSTDLDFIDPSTGERYLLEIHGLEGKEGPGGLCFLLMQYSVFPELPKGRELLIAALDEEGAPWDNSMQTSSAEQEDTRIKTVLMGSTRSLPSNVTVELMGILEKSGGLKEAVLL